MLNVKDLSVGDKLVLVDRYNGYGEFTGLTYGYTVKRILKTRLVVEFTNGDNKTFERRWVLKDNGEVSHLEGGNKYELKYLERTDSDRVKQFIARNTVMTKKAESSKAVQAVFNGRAHVPSLEDIDAAIVALAELRNAVAAIS